jgi:acyl-CoA synthetase (AMP-forming)/AMP-acid ligase II
MERIMSETVRLSGRESECVWAPPLEQRLEWRTLGLHGERNLGEAFAQAAAAFPDAPLVISTAAGETRMTLAELHTRGLALAAALSAEGLRTGDVLAVQLPNSLEGVLAQRAAAALGAVFLPIVPIYGAAELSEILRDANARMLVLPAATRHGSAQALLDALNPARTLPGLWRTIVVGEPASGNALRWSTLIHEVGSGAGIVLSPSRADADDPALLIYTSGTTAAPKGVQHSANTLLAESRTAAQHRANPLTAQLSPWPTGHIAGLVVLLEHALRGRPTVLMDAWDPARAAALVERFEIGASSGTPFHLTALLDAADAGGLALATLHDYLTGAAPVPSALVQRCVERGIATYRAYGLSEHPTVTLGWTDDALETRLHTEGSLSAGNQIRIVDEAGCDAPRGEDGEIVTRGPERFLGYRDTALNRAAFLPGGWFLTGDIGHLDAEGFLHITDRKKDIVNRGGEKISSREVEEALALLPQVAEVAVVGSPDPRVGERICAFVVWREGNPLALDEVAAHFAGLGKARQKTPERLEAIAALPRNAAGKINKQALRERLRAM